MTRSSSIPSGAGKLPTNVKLLGFASLLNDVASEMIAPLMPHFFVNELGGTKSLLGLMEGIADSLSSLLKLWSGAISDRVQARKAFITIGYGVAALTRPLSGLVVAPWQLLALRAVDRAGKGVRTSPRDALIAESTDESIRGRAYGFHRAMDHLGAATGPILAIAFLTAVPGALRALFLATVIPGAAVVLLLAVGLRESTSAQPDRAGQALTLAPFDRNFRRYLVALVIFTLGHATDAFLLLRAQEVGVSVDALPAIWCGFHVLKSIGALKIGRLSDRAGAMPMVLAGWLLHGAVYVGFAGAGAAWHAVALFAAYAVFYALTEPTERALAASLAGAAPKGLAFGWYHFAVGLATLPASLLFGVIYERWGSWFAFGIGATLSVMAAAVLLSVQTPTSNRTAPATE